MADRSGDDDPQGARIAAELRRELRASPAPRVDLVERVMREVAQRPAPGRRRGAVLDWLWRPRAVGALQLRPATALVMSSAALLLLAFAPWSRRAQPSLLPAPAPLVAQPVAPAVPSVPSVPSVRFAMVAPAARVVAVAGDFNDWRPEPLSARPDGWVLDRSVPPGSWRYAFVVDGRWVEDPAAASYSPDGFGGRNAVLRL